MTDDKTTIPLMHIEYPDDDGEGLESIELAKRTYIPGVVLHSRCPKCGRPWKLDLGDDYLSYPETGKPTRITAYCEGKCHEEWVAGYVRVEITVDPCDENGDDVENGEPPEPPAPPNPAALKAYEVYDGESYWIAAKDEAEARALWVEQCSDGAELDEHGNYGLSVSLVSEERLTKLRIDDDGTKKSVQQLLNEHLAAGLTNAFLIGASVY
jgi:hypothetical protein